jgi:tRNA nucleotidyltransferase/poly(A) polymerase
VRDLIFFSACENNKIKTLNTEKLIEYINNYKIPKFPISGDSLKEHGYVTGEELGKKLKSLEAKWIENDFVIEKKIIEKSLEKVNKN